MLDLASMLCRVGGALLNGFETFRWIALLIEEAFDPYLEGRCWEGGRGSSNGVCEM